jgi:hypothetical protein
MNDMVSYVFVSPHVTLHLYEHGVGNGITECIYGGDKGINVNLEGKPINK